MSDERASERVHDRLRRDVLTGVLAPGARVPSERALAVEHGVNRHAVREALKRLQQAGLVAISQGGPTRVHDWERTGGLEVLLDLVDPSDGPVPEHLLRGIVEMRASIGVDAARRCAQRGSADVRADVAARAAACAPRLAAGEDVLDDYAALWELVVVGAQNLAYRLSLNSLVLALATHPELLALTVPSPDDAPLLVALGRAVGDGDAEGASAAARGLLERD